MSLENSQLKFADKQCRINAEPLGHNSSLTSSESEDETPPWDDAENAAQP